MIDLNLAIVSITSALAGNNEFSTGFLFHSDRKFYYILTTAHSIETKPVIINKTAGSKNRNSNIPYKARHSILRIIDHLSPSWQNGIAQA